jgi:hypothetical protein
MTHRVRHACPRRDQHNAITILDVVDMQVTKVREEHIETEGIHTRRGMLHNDPRGRSLMISSWSNKIFTMRPHPRTASYPIAITKS